MGECAREGDDFHTDTVLGKLFTKIKNDFKGIDSMCGFVVRIGNISCYEDGLIEKMLNSIEHRGPDNRAVWLNNNIQMGHVRLSILDISSDANSLCPRNVIAT